MLCSEPELVHTDVICVRFLRSDPVVQTLLRASIILKIDVSFVFSVCKAWTCSVVHVFFRTMSVQCARPQG